LPSCKGKFSVRQRRQESLPLQFESSESQLRVAPPRRPTALTLTNLVLVIGCVLLIVPTMLQVARETWSTEQGGHGPLVLATGLWALWRELKNNKVEWHPGNPWIGVPLLAVALSLFVIARITGVLEIEAFMMYGTVVAGAYLVFGGPLMRVIWFPLIYLAFALPPPDTVVAAVTQPIKIAISEWAVAVLYAVGYPVAQSGVIIQIGQYQLLVAAACAGLNSIVTLAALCMFYVYLTHRSSLAAFLIVAVAAIPVAVISNFVRVLVLVLVTYHLGEAAAQGFVHDFAGLLMFAVALLTLFGIDHLTAPLLARRGRRGAA
jgi:exosortase B